MPVAILFFVVSFQLSSGLQNMCSEFANCECHKDAAATSISCTSVSNITVVSEIQKHLNFSVINYVRIRGSVSHLRKEWIRTENIHINVVKLKCPIQTMEDESLTNIHSLTNFEIIKSKFVKIPKAIGKLSRLKALFLKQGELQELDDELQHMIYLRFLSLQKNKIEKISARAFVNNSLLRKITLSQNRIKYFEPGTFRSCRSIFAFRASSNSIRSMVGIVESDVLTVLNLADNGLSSLEGLFQRYPSLENIYVGRNKRLNHLSDSVFAGSFRYLKTLHINNCKLRQLPPKLIQPLFELQYLDLKLNWLRTIPQGFFHNLRKLRVVDLTGNGLFSLGDAPFVGTSKLATLLLRANHLQSLHGVFKFLSSVAKIDLARNKELKTITESDFKDCFSLEHLVLTDCRLTSIHPGAFANLTSLKYLDMSRNKIPFLKGALRPLQRLKFLDLGSNRLGEDREIDFSELLQLETLNLRHNRLTSVSGAFRRLCSLKALMLEKNLLQVLSRTAFPKEISALRSLKASKNQWRCDCRLSWIRDLLASGTVVEDDKPFNCLEPKRLHGRKLRHLLAADLVHWPEDCPEECRCSCVPQNETLYIDVDCSGKGLVKVPTPLPPQTGRLSLQDNFLSSPLSYDFSWLENLRHLNLERNLLKDLDLKLPANLTELRLAGNNLTRFYSNKKPPKGVTLWTLSGNLWVCDCLTKTFREWIISNRNTIPDANFTRCGHGNAIQSLDGKVIISLTEADLCPNFISLYVSVAVSVLLMLLLATTSRLMYSRYHYHIKVWLYSRGFKWLKKTEDVDSGKMYDAFLSSADQDVHFLKNYIIPELEEKEPYYVLFEPRRDMRAGEMFELNKEMEEVTKSKRIIILLSKDYIENKFLMEVFNWAFGSSLEEKLYRIILIEVGDLPPLSGVDQSLKAALESNRCLRFGQKVFWEMLRFAMPDKPVKKRGNIEEDSTLLTP